MKIKTKLSISFIVFSNALFLLTLSGVTLGSDSDPGVQVLYEDQSSPECLEYLQERSGEGNHESNGLKLNPDRWHGSVYRLYCGGGERRDFTAYDVIEFHFKSSGADPGNPAFYVKTWNQTSNLVSIADYIDGGLIDHTWRRVTIPLADLRTAAWDLGNVESLNWSKDSCERSYYTDDIVLRTTNPPVLITLRIFFSPNLCEFITRRIISETINGHLYNFIAFHSNYVNGNAAIKADNSQIFGAVYVI